MPTVWIPALLRPLTRQQDSVHVNGQTLLEVIDALEAQFSGIRTRLCDGDALKPGLAVVIDAQVWRGDLSEPIPPNSEVHFVPAIGGGDCRQSAEPYLR
jgi:sulfur-carrier protein